MSENKELSSNLYQLDGDISPAQAVPFGLQHILAMFVPNIAPIFIVGSACKLAPNELAFLIQAAMIIAGIGTMIQVYPIGPIGSRLPIVMGISFTFVSCACVIGAQYGYNGLIGAVIAGGIIEGILGLTSKFWLKYITRTISACVVTCIGFSLLPIGAASFGGGFGAKDFGSVNNLIVGSITLISCLAFTVKARGIYRQLSVLFGLTVGYITAICMGMVNFDLIKKADIIALPHVLPFAPEFNLNAIIAITLIFMVSATETIGDTSAVTISGLNRQVKESELSGSVVCDGFVSALSGVFGCLPITSFSQNVGLIAMTHVVNRRVIAAGAGIMIIAGLFPIIGAVLATLPEPVLGGCTIMMFGNIVISGMSMMKADGLSSRNITIAALSLSIGLGFTSMPKLFDAFPALFKTVFAENCVAVVFLVAMILHLTLPKDMD